MDSGRLQLLRKDGFSLLLRKADRALFLVRVGDEDWVEAHASDADRPGEQALGRWRIGDFPMETINDEEIWYELVEVFGILCLSGDTGARSPWSEVRGFRGRKTLPVRDDKDVETAIQEASAVARQPDASEADLHFLREVNHSVSLFKTNRPEHSNKPTPWNLLAYLLSYVKMVGVEKAAHETGIVDMEDLLEGNRAPTADESEVLSRYFEVAPDAFVWDDYQGDKTDWW